MDYCCYICQDNSNISTNPIVSTKCVCKGNLGKVHDDCYKNYITFNPIGNIQCPNCKVNYLKPYINPNILIDNSEGLKPSDRLILVVNLILIIVILTQFVNIIDLLINLTFVILVPIIMYAIIYILETIKKNIQKVFKISEYEFDVILGINIIE